MFSYVLNGPLTLIVVVVGSLLNTCTIYVLSIYTISRYRRQQRTAGSLKNIAYILRANNSIKRQRDRPSHGRESSETASATNVSLRARCDCDTQRSQHGSARPRIYTFLLWLSASDTALLASALLMYGVPVLMQGHLESTYVQLTSFFYWISNSALIASVWLMCALTFDRYRTISQSFKRSKQSTGTINKGLCIVCTAAVVFAFPRFFEIQAVYDADSQEYYPVQTLLVRSQVYMVGYRILGGLLFYSLLPYVLLFLLSLKIWLVMRESASVRLKISSVKSSTRVASLQNQAGKIEDFCQQGDDVRSRSGSGGGLGSGGSADSSELILLCVVGKFLLSRLMPTMLDMVEHVIGSDEFTQSATLTVVVDVSNLMVVISSAANFFIFYTLSRSFRATSTECCCTKRRVLQRELVGSRRHLRKSWSQLSRRDKGELTNSHKVLEDLVTSLDAEKSLSMEQGIATTSTLPNSKSSILTTLLTSHDGTEQVQLAERSVSTRKVVFRAPCGDSTQETIPESYPTELR